MISVTCAIIERDGMTLAAQRAQDTHLAGQWEFPGGKVADGESEEACIIREIREELGVGIRPIKRLNENTHDYGDKHIRLIPFICELVAGEPRAREHATIRWLSLEDLSTLWWCEADIPILRQVIESGPVSSSKEHA